MSNRFKQLHKSGHFQVQLSFDFPKSIPPCPGNAITFLQGSHLLQTSFLQLSSVKSFLLRQAGLQLCLFCSADGWTALFLKRLSLTKDQFSRVLLSFRAASYDNPPTCLPTYPEQAKVCSSEIQGLLLAFVTFPRRS